MKIFFLVLGVLLVSLAGFSDTPPPGTVKAKTFSGDGLTGVTTTGTSLNVNVTNSGGASTVNQGTGGVSPWLVNVNNSSLPVTQSGLWSVDQSGAPWSFSLPSGAATSALQTSGNASLTSIDSKLTSPLTVTGPLTDTQLRASAVPVSGIFFQSTQPVSASSLPLPSGASTAALQTSGNASLTSIDSKLTSPIAVTGSITATNSANGATGAAVPAQGTQIAGSDGTNLRAVKVSSTGVVSIDGSAVTQPVSAASLPLPSGAATSALQTSGNASLTSIDSKLTSPLAVTGTFFQATQPVSAASLPLPSGAATSALQTSGNASLTSIDSKLTSPLAVTGPLTDTQLRASPIPISGSITATNSANGATGAAVPAQGTQIAGSDGTNLRAVKVSSTGVVSIDGSAVTQPVSAASLPLPSGAATSALQTSGNASLTSIDSKLTSPLAVTGPLTDTQLRASAVPISGSVGVSSIAAGAGVQILDSAGTNKLAVGTAGNILVSGLASVGSPPSLNPISVSGIDGAGNKQHLKQITGTNALVVDGSAVTQPISSASLTSIDTKTPALGQALAAASAPVVLTAAQITTLTPLSTVTANIGTSGSLALDATLTAGTQTTRITDGTNTATVKAASTAAVATDKALVVALSPNNSITTTNSANGATGAAVPAQATQIAGSDGTNLRAVKVSSTGVVSIDGSAVTQPVSAASLPLPSGASTETTLAALNTKTPALGAATTANSRPVNIASDQVVNTMLPDLIVVGAAAQTATVNNILPAASGATGTDLSGYKSALVQVVSTGTAGTFIFEGSNDPSVNYQTVTVYNQAISTGTPITAAITATATQIGYVFPVQFRYYRLRIATAITGGSIQASSRFTQATWAPSVFQVAQATTANLQTTSTIASGTVTTVSSVTAVASVTSSQTAIPGTIADVASAAITVTTTTATLTPTFGSSYQINIPVTAVSGTTPTMDIQVQESLDTGTNWMTVYTFPQITATGFYQSPVLMLQGNRVRYIQTIGGTTPSFTRAINRLQDSGTAVKVAPSQGILVDGSGSTSATPSTSTQIFAANPNRRYLFIQNLDATNPIYINFTSAAANNTGSLAIAAGGSFVMESSFVSLESVNVLSAAASIKFTAKQQ